MTQQVSLLSSGELTEEEIEETEEFQLPKDMYSVMTTWTIDRSPVWVALAVVVVQIMLLSLLLIDQIGDGTDDSFQVFPANVPSIVHISQGLAIVIATLGQDDLRIAIEGIFDGIPTRFKGDTTFHNVNRLQWNFSYGTRFVQGLLSVLAAFVLALQSETVFDVLLNFLGVKFVSELDDLTFLLSELGYFGADCRQAAKSISEADFQQDNRNKVAGRGCFHWLAKYAHVIGVFTVLVLLLGLFVSIVIDQNDGELAVTDVRLTFSNDIFPLFGLFNGCYRRSNTRQTYDRRLVYEQVGYINDGGKFAYCNNMDGDKGWTFHIGDIKDPCKNFIARSDATKTFDILNAGSQWYVDGGVPLDYTQISKVLEGSRECDERTYSWSQRDNGCELIDLLGYADDTEAVSMKFYEVVVDNSTKPTVFTRLPLSHSIYVRESSEPASFTITIFTGR